jgi:Mechanosensitive ion channel, transmembrane helices 2/3
LGVRDEHANRRARRARRELFLLAPTIVGVVIVYANRVQLFGVDAPVRVSAGVALVMLGWASARAVGRAAAPSLARRGIDIAGPVGFIIRLGTVAIALVIALRLVGLDPTTLAAGGAVTAIVVGLAAQQTFGNLFAGIVLLSARPFRSANGSGSKARPRRRHRGTRHRFRAALHLAWARCRQSLGPSTFELECRLVSHRRRSASTSARPHPAVSVSDISGCDDR